MKTTGLTIITLTAGLALFGASAVATFAADKPASTPPATTETPTTPPPAESKTAADTTTQGDPNEKICKKVTVPDSRIPITICMTRAEWEKPNE